MVDQPKKESAVSEPSDTTKNPLDVKSTQKQDSEMIKNIVSTETAQEQMAILGEAPEIDSSLLQELGPPKSLALISLKFLFSFLVFVSVVSFIFFSSQLTNFFDFVTTRFNLPNISKDLASTNSEVINLQTDLNLFRYLQIKSFLSEFSLIGDSYIKNFNIVNSPTSSELEKNGAKTKLASLRKELQESFVRFDGKFKENFVSPLVDKSYQDDAALKSLFETELSITLSTKAGELISIDDAQAKRDYKSYLQTQNLVTNDPLKNLILQTDFVALSDEELASFINQVNDLIVNDLSIIQKIKDTRIKWSDIINEIDRRTIAVDSHYDENYFDVLGGITYTNYDFDADSRRVSIIGVTKTFDTATFTLIANLIDEINRSEIFANGEMRSFTKSGSAEDGYKATLKLSFDLEEESTEENAVPIDNSTVLPTN